MDYFDKYAERLRVQGTLTAKSEEDRMVEGMRRDWESNPSFRRVCVLQPDGTKKHIRLQTAKKTVGIDKIYIHPDDRVVSGSIILSLQEFAWLVMDVRFIGHVFQQANIVRINRVLKYMDGDVVKTIQARVKGFSRVDGIDEYYYFTMPENTINVFVPYNEETAKFTRDKRIMIDKIPYKLSRVDNFTHTGVTIWFLVEDIRNPQDTDEIADYIEPAEPPIVETMILGPEVIPYGFSGNFTLTDGINILSPVWGLETTANWVTLTVLNDVCTAQISRDSAHIGKTIILQAEINDTVYIKPIMIGSLV